MIELRWLRYQHHSELQYRQRECGIMKTNAGDVLRAHGEWSDWKSVPEVSFRDVGIDVSGVQDE